MTAVREQALTDLPVEAKGGRAGRRLRLHVLEDAVVSLAIGVMIVLPLAEIVLRRTLHAGIPAATLIVQHFALIVGMLGGAVAAREGRLLTLSTVADTVLRDRLKSAAHAFTAAVGCAVTVFLGVAGARFVVTEREVGKILLYGIPVWTIELALPLGFVAIALRLLHRASE